MGLLHAQKGMVWWTICVILPVMSAASLCHPGRQYWDEESEKCLDCRNCSTVHGEVVLRPCQVHQDTQCGPLSALQIDWSFLRPKSSTKKYESSTFIDSEKIDEKSVDHHYNKKHERSKSHSRSKSKHHHHHHHHDHNHQHHHHHQSKFFQSMESMEESSHSKESPEDIRTSRKHQRKTIKWNNRNSSSSTHHSVEHHHNNLEPQYNSSTRSRIHHSKGHSFLSGKALPQSASLVKIAEEPVLVSSGLVATSTMAALLQSPSSPAPFSTAEEIVWDWQAIALALAVFACILFFLVAGAYSIHHARQWRRLKDNFEADVEELSTTLSLMAPGSHPDANQCVYMEQLLVRKQQVEADETEQGNVYIDRDKTHPQHVCN